MRILIVDDDRQLAAFLQHGLEEEGYAVDVLHDGADAADQARWIEYDAAVLDLMLPGRSGFQVLRDVRALLRRGKRYDTRLRVADLEMDVARRIVTRGGRRIDLKPKEYALLEFLMRNSDRPVTRSLIIEHVWDLHFETVSNVVEVHINSLRNKIDRGFGLPLIQTLRGVGYMLTAS